MDVYVGIKVIVYVKILVVLLFWVVMLYIIVLDGIFLVMFKVKGRLRKYGILFMLIIVILMIVVDDSLFVFVIWIVVFVLSV